MTARTVAAAVVVAEHTAAVVAALLAAHPRATVEDGDAAPTLAAWADAGGVTVQRLRYLRRCSPALAALPTRGRGARPRADATPKSVQRRGQRRGLRAKK